MKQYDYLAEHVLETMALNDAERINILYEDRWIGYQKAITVLNILNIANLS